MAIVSKPYYLAKCDGCGHEADDADYGEYSAFGSEDRAIEEATEAGWTRKGDVLHCQACPPLEAED